VDPSKSIKSAASSSTSAVVLLLAEQLDVKKTEMQFK